MTPKNMNAIVARRRRKPRPRPQTAAPLHGKQQPTRRLGSWLRLSVSSNARQHGRRRHRGRFAPSAAMGQDAGNVTGRAALVGIVVRTSMRCARASGWTLALAGAAFHTVLRSSQPDSRTGNTSNPCLSATRNASATSWLAGSTHHGGCATASTRRSSALAKRLARCATISHAAGASATRTSNRPSESLAAALDEHRQSRRPPALRGTDGPMRRTRAGRPRGWSSSEGDRRPRCRSQPTAASRWSPTRSSGRRSPPAEGDRARRFGPQLRLVLASEPHTAERLSGGLR